MLPFSFQVVFSFFIANILIVASFVRYCTVFKFLLKNNCFRLKKKTLKKETYFYYGLHDFASTNRFWALNPEVKVARRRSNLLSYNCYGRKGCHSHLVVYSYKENKVDIFSFINKENV